MDFVACARVSWIYLCGLCEAGYISLCLFDLVGLGISFWFEFGWVEFEVCLARL